MKHMPWLRHIFKKSLSKLPSKYIIGLTATPDRLDGLGYALPWLLGDIAYRSIRVNEQPVSVQFVCYKDGPQIPRLDRTKQPSIARMVNDLVDDNTRTNLILAILNKLVLQQNTNRQVLLLTDRRNHVLLLASLLNEMYNWPDLVGVIMGGQRESIREQEMQKRIIISTYHFFAEGQDVPRLDTLLLCTPRSNIEQAVGRILRPSKTKQPPIIVDIWDNYSVFPYMKNKRAGFYYKSKYNIIDCTEHYNINK